MIILLLFKEYAKKLTAAGVYNELILVEGALHAFYTLTGRSLLLRT